MVLVRNISGIRQQQVMPDTIDNTGTTDVWNDIMGWLGTFSKTNVSIQLRPGRYRMNKQIPIYNARDLHWAGNGAEFFFTDGGIVPADHIPGSTQDDRERSNLMFQDPYNVRISDMFVRGAFPQGAGFDVNREAQCGFEIVAGQGVQLIDSRAEDVYGDFVYFGVRSPTLPYSQDCTVRGFTGVHSGRQGMATIRANGLVIEQCDLDLIGRSGFDLEPTGSYLPVIVERTVIRNNRIRRVGSGNFVSAAADQYTQDVWITDNVCDEPLNIRVSAGTANGTAPVQINSRWHILRNQGGGLGGQPAHSVMRLQQLVDAEIRGNVQTLRADTYLVGYQGIHTGNVSTGNTVPGGPGQWWYERPIPGTSNPVQIYYPPGVGDWG